MLLVHGLNHKQDRCFQRTSFVPCSVVTAGKQCGKQHHQLLHGSDGTYCRDFTSSSKPPPSKQLLVKLSSSSLFELLQVPVASSGGGCSVSILMMVDSGSTDNFISHELAAKLQITGTPTLSFCKLWIKNCQKSLPGSIT